MVSLLTYIKCFISGKDVLFAVAHTSLADPQASASWPPSQPCGLHGTLPDRLFPGTKALHHMFPRLPGSCYCSLLLWHW